jgi:hypothetical protein
MTHNNEIKTNPPARGFRPFCTFILVVPFAGLLAVLTYGRSDFFLRSKGPWFLNLDHAYHYSGQQCDVLIFGDSTAVTGLDPKLITAETNLRTCNIAQTRSQFTVLGTQTLDSFLRRNPPPRYLVIQMAPDAFRIDRDWELGHYGEGMLQLLRNRPLSESTLTFVRHPNASIQFAGWIFSTLPGTIGSSLHHKHPDNQVTQDADGFITYPLPSESSCIQTKSPQPPPLNQPDAAWIRSLRQRYSKPGTSVLIDASPIPGCDKQFAYLSQALAGLSDNQLESYPVAMYNEGDRHFTPAGAAARSNELAQQLLSISGATRKEEHAF